MIAAAALVNVNYNVKIAFFLIDEVLGDICETGTDPPEIA